MSTGSPLYTTYAIGGYKYSFSLGYMERKSSDTPGLSIPFVMYWKTSGHVLSA